MGKKNRKNRRQKTIMAEVIRMDAIHRQQVQKNRGMFRGMIYSGKKALSR